MEGAGEIDALGSSVEGYSIGDRVAVVPAYGAGDFGLCGEYALVPARSLVRIPDGVDWEDAAATWMSFATAWAGLIDIGRLSEGQTVLVSAASSSAGLAAIQVARKVGATPVALTRTSLKTDALLAAGAAFVISTAEQDVVAEVAQITAGAGADLVLDPVGGPGFSELVRATSVGGTLVVYGALSVEPAELPVMSVLARGLTIQGFGLPQLTRVDAKLAALKRFVGEGLAAGELKPSISKVFPFEEIVAAYEYLEAGTQIGKIVVTT